MKQSWIGKVFFHEIDPVVRLGAKKSLGPEDLPALPAHLNPRTIPVDENKIEWSSGSRLIATLYGVTKRIWVPAVGFILATAFLNLSTPLLVNAFVSALEKGAEGDSVWVMGALIGIVGMASGLCIQHFFYRVLGMNQVVTNVLNKRLFTHALKLSKESREQVPVGDIVNHMSSDTDSIAESSAVAPDLLYNLVVLVGAGFMMLYYLGWTALLAWALLLALIPLTRRVGRRFSHMDHVLMQERDRRVTLMSQILTAIRVVKFFVWEESVTREVRAVRERELKARERWSIAELQATLGYVAISTIVLFLVLLVHSLRGFELSAALVFTCVSLFNLLEDPFANLSRQISGIISAKVAAERITSFLTSGTVARVDVRQAPLPGQPVVELRDWSLAYGGAENAVLKNVDLTIARGEKIAVVGLVGAGKSSLLLGLLGEIGTRGGSRAVRAAKIAYVPQEAYLVNGTLRANLLLGESAADERLELSLRRSCLDEDMRLWDAGLDTEIGERGVNLSGGQKQRLSLARADLQDADLLLLDDPLSAVDPQTEAKLVKRLLLDSWRGKTCLVATHRLEHLADFDRVVYLRQSGVWAEGPHSSLMRDVPEYREFLAEHEKTQNAEFGKTERGDAATEMSGSTAKITQDEERQQGAVRGSVYGDYLRSLGGTNLRLRPLRWFALIVAACASTALPLIQKSWLGFVTNVQNGTRALPEWLTPFEVQEWILTPWRSVVVYGGLGLFTLAGILCADLFWIRRGLAAGRELHDAMLRSVLGSPIRFFDSTPVGRILQRFSRDMSAVDTELQWTFEQSMKAFASVFVTLALIFSVLPVVLICVIPILFVYWRYQKLYRQAAREVKRLDSIARSPRYAHFKETLQGLVVIRAYGREGWFFEEFARRLQESQRMFFGHYLINRWFSTRIPVIGGLIAVATGLAIVASVKSGALSPGIAGLLTIYSLSFWGILNWGIRLWADVEARMTSVERIRYLSSLPQEKAVTHANGESSEAAWPSQGHVEFRGVKARYAPELPWVLKGVSFDIKGGSRVGLIGRTGSGKSTIFQALYRFIELEEGEILVDGVSLSAVPLARLRKALAVIPQDPTLFLGTLRSNLDRFGQFQDREIQIVLERTRLKTWIESLPDGLETRVVENGHNLSQGQRQLLCLARALLLKAKILIMDEATASVDVQTDALIQKLVREECQGMTIIMIAHRLGTVRDCDQVIELADGQVRRVLHPKAKIDSQTPVFQ